MKFLSVMPNLYVADVEASAAFYRDLLGGTETFRAPASGASTHVEIRVGDVLIAVSSRDEVAPRGLPSPSGGHRQARRAGPHPFQPACARGRGIRLRGSRARAALRACPAVGACTAGARPAGARS